MGVDAHNAQKRQSNPNANCMQQALKQGEGTLHRHTKRGGATQCCGCAPSRNVGEGEGAILWQQGEGEFSALEPMNDLRP